jgi:parallel beta-helix repeat protein
MWLFGTFFLASCMILFASLPAIAGINQWTGNGPHGGAITAIAVHPPTPGTIYAGTWDTGAFRSTDGGGSWLQINTGLSNTHIRALAIDPITPTTIYAGTASASAAQGLFKSTNGGDSWEPACNGLNGILVDTIAIDPKTPTTVYAGTYGGGVFKSTDGAQSWNQINAGLTNTTVVAIVVDPNMPTTLYVVNGGVFKSTNSGDSWSPIYVRYPNVVSLALDTNNPANLYAGTYNGVFKSTDSGTDWNFAGTGLPVNAAVYSAAVDPSDSATLYAISTGGIYKSTNSGTSWSLANYGLSPADVNTLTVAPSRLYAGTGGGIVNVMQVIDPFFTTVAPLAGTFTSAANISLKASRPATIYYTTDGSDPQTSMARQIYSAPIPIANTTTLKYYAEDGSVVEPVQTAVYTIIGPLNLNFTYGGAAPWFNQTTVSYDGIGAYQSGAISNSQSSWMETTVTGPGAVRFWWKVSSEPCCDRLSFTIDGLYQADIRGETDWQSKAFTIADGGHTLRWAYSTDSYGLSGSNAGWVDQIILEQGNNIDTVPPVTTASPSGGLFVSNPSVSLTCNDGSGSGCAATYYCFGNGCSPTTPFNGTPISVVGQSVLRFYSVDATGNSETVKTASYTITTDATPPTTTPNHPSGAYNDPNIYLFCDDGSGTGCGATYYCLGEGCTPTTPYNNSPVYLSTPSISYYSTDLAGNKETVKTSTYTIDTLAPITVANPPGGLYPAALTVTLTCNDGSGTGCSGTFYCLGTDCNPATPYNGAITIAASNDLRFFSRDTVSNEETIHTVRYTIPTTNPVVFNVPADKATIQEAIDGASDGDAILVATGTYAEHLNFKGKAVTVQSSDGPDATVIDGGQNGLVVKFVSGEGPSSVLKGFTVRNGLHSGNDTPCTGGGICVYWSSPTITNNKIVDNFGCIGVGIEVGNGSPTIQDNIISNNAREFCTGGQGGAGISVSGGTGTRILRNVVSKNNIADGSGGGIYLSGTANATVKDNIIKNNRAGMEGGGIDISSADAQLIQNEITGNVAAQGGGIYLGSSMFNSPALINNTIVENLGSLGSGVFTDGNNISATLVNNIIAGKAGQSAVHCGNANGYPTPKFKNNLIHSASGSAISGVCTDQNGINGNISADPLLNNPYLGYYAPLAGSPAIDAGDSSYPDLPGTDLAGSPRIIDGNGDATARVDMGAYEYDPSMPHATISGGPTGLTNSIGEIFTIGGDPIASFRASVDGGPFSDEQFVANPLTVPLLAEGPHTVAVVGKNTQGREQTIPYATVASWYVDTTSPVTSATPPGGTLSSPNVTLSCSDGTGSGCSATYYCLGSGCTPSLPYTAPIAISLPDIRFYSVDLAGNREDIKTLSFTIPPPVTTATPGMGTYRDAQNITLICSSVLSTGCTATYYCLGTGCTPSVLYTGPVAVSSLTVLRFYSTDIAGNSEQAKSYEYIIDPSLAYRFERLWPQLPQPWYFRQPQGVAVDAGGNVYVADSDNYRIQKYDSRGIFLAQWSTSGRPWGIGVDGGGNVYVANQSGGHNIQKFDSNGNYLTQWGTYGSDNGQLKYPEGLTVDALGTIYVADTGNSRIQKFDSSGAYLTQWGTGGSGNGQFSRPDGLAVDVAGTIYVADTGNNRIQRFAGDGTYLGQWGLAGSSNGQFSEPLGVAVGANGNVYVSDSFNQRIQKFDKNGKYLSQWGSYGNADGQFMFVGGVAVSASGNVYVTDINNGRIQEFDGSGNYLNQMDSQGSSSGQFRHPSGAAADASGNVYVADAENNRIEKFDGNGNYLTQWSALGNGNGRLYNPQGVAVDGTGNVYVADAYNRRIVKFTSSGAYLSQWVSVGSGNNRLPSEPSAVAVDTSGNVYVTTWDNNILKFDSNGNYLTEWGSAGSGNGQFEIPLGVAVDRAGNVYVADSSNYRIQKFDSTGHYLTGWTTNGWQFNGPNGVAVDGSGNIHVTDWSDRIRKFDGNGNYLTAWGGTGSGNGQFRSPRSVAVDINGNVYVVDTDNNRIQKFSLAVSVPGAPTGVTANADSGAVTINFTAPASDGGSPILFYTVTASPGNVSVIGASSPIRVTGLTSGTTYTFTVTATNAAGAGAPSVASGGFRVANLTTHIIGKGTINNLTQPPTFSCSWQTCRGQFNEGAFFTLRATPAQFYTFTGWSDGCSGTGDCTLTLTSDTTVTATFTPVPLVQIVGTTTPYASFAAALTDAAGSSTLRARDVVFSEDLALNRTLDIILFGGFRDDFTTVDGFTGLQGTLTLGLGSLTVDGLAIR